MPSTIYHCKLLPAGAHPCGAHPCQADGGIVHGSSTQTAGTTLCGLAASVPSSPIDADTSAPSCKTCENINKQG